MNQNRKQMSLQWYGGILSYATTSLLIDLQKNREN